MAWESPKSNQTPEDTWFRSGNAPASGLSRMQPEPALPPAHLRTPYSRERVQPLLDRVMTGESVRSICSDPVIDLSRNTFSYWLATVAELQVAYAEAKEAGVENIVEEMFDIADDGRNDWMLRLAFNGSHPSWEACGEHIARAKIRVDLRKWYVGQIKPKKYGIKQQLEVSGELGNVAKLNAGRQRVADARKRLETKLDPNKVNVNLFK